MSSWISRFRRAIRSTERQGLSFNPKEPSKRTGHLPNRSTCLASLSLGMNLSVMGSNGPLCYLALDWNPVEVVPLHVDSHTWHNYKIRLRMVNKTKWLGIVHVDGAKLCRLSLPPFGPLEVHIWSDNYLMTIHAQTLVGDCPAQWISNSRMAATSNSILGKSRSTQRTDETLLQRLNIPNTFDPDDLRMRRILNIILLALLVISLACLASVFVYGRFYSGCLEGLTKRNLFSSGSGAMTTVCLA